jgi:hypothetical protein
LGALSFRRSAAQPECLTPLSSSEVTRVQATIGLDSDLPQRAIVGDIPSASGSSDVAVLRNKELGLPGFP